MERPFFFENEGKRLYGMAFSPEAGARRRACPLPGVLLCSPFAEEKLWAQRVMVSFARRLSHLGAAAMVFDYRGHGDSQCDFVESTMETRLADIARAVEVLREQTGAERVGLLGLRLGGTLAAAAAAGHPGVDALILWEPVIDAREYLYQCLRSNLATQLAVHGAVTRKRDELVADLEEGRPVNVDGYLLSGELYRQAARIHLGEAMGRVSVPVLLVKIVRKEGEPVPEGTRSLLEPGGRANPGSRLCTAVEQPFWTQRNLYVQRAANLFAATEEWLETVLWKKP